MKIGAPVLLVLAALAVSALTVPSSGESSAASTTVTDFPKSFDLALISARSGAVLQVSNLADGPAVADGHGGWFLVFAGRGLAHLFPDGKLDSGWGTGESRSLRSVSLLVKSGSRLYAEVDLAKNALDPKTGVRDLQVAVIEAFDAGTGARLWVGPRIPQLPASLASSSTPSGGVYALAASSARVFVGGEFARVGGIHRDTLAALDAKTGRLVDWRPPPLHIDIGLPSVKALALAGSRLYVGGIFDSIGGKSRVYLAALNPTSGALLPWKPVGVNDASAILVTRGQVITGGEDGFAATSVRSGRPISWPSRIGGYAHTFAADGPLVYLGGDIRRGCCGTSNLGAFNLATGRKTSWNPYLGVPYASIGQIVPSGERLLVIGSFTDSIG